MKDKYFDDSDVDLLTKALALIPEVELAVYSTKIFRDLLTFPVNSVKDLEPAFAELGDQITFKAVAFDLVHATNFPPDFCFPIENEDDLMRTAIIGFTAAAVSHNQAHQALLRKKCRQSGLSVQFPPGYSMEFFRR